MWLPELLKLRELKELGGVGISWNCFKRISQNGPSGVTFYHRIGKCLKYTLPRVPQICMSLPFECLNSQS